MKTSRLVIALSVLIVSLLLVTGALAAARGSTANQTPPPPAGFTLPVGDGPWVVRAYYGDPLLVSALAQSREPWEVNAKEGYIVIDVDAEEYMWLQWQGFRLEVDESRTKTLNQPRGYIPGQTEGIPAYPCYRTVEETYASAEQMAADYPDLATWIDMGNSWEKVNTDPPDLPGYDLKVLKLTNKNIPGTKPKFFAMTAVHAREYATAELATRFAEYMLENYGKDPDITWILDYNEIHLLLQANPDGRKIAETGDLWRKNTDRDDGCSVPSSWGTDLNRNFNFQWGCCGGSDTNPCYETYRGPLAGSEPETQAVQNYLILNFPDQRPDDLTTPAPVDATGVFLDIHSYSELVLWPWGFSGDPAPNSTGLQTLGRKLAFFNNYYPDQSIGLYPTDGTTVDFAYGKLGMPAYTFEIGTSFFQDCGSFESTIYPDNLEALIYAAKIPRTPYMTPAGPDTLGVLASPAAVAPGEPVELTAQVNDMRYNNSNGTEPITYTQAAEFYIDVPPWSTDPAPIAFPMDATDGAFNETIENVSSVLDTSSLSNGRHMIFVRGQDADGNWGPVSAAFLFVGEEGFILSPATGAKEGAPGTTVTYTLNLTNSMSVSNTFDLTLSGNGWETVLSSESIGPVPPGEAGEFSVAAEIPIDASAGASDTVTVTASSQASGILPETSVLTTSASAQFSMLVNVADNEQAGFPAEPVTYSIMLTNTSNTTDTIDIQASGVWTATVTVSPEAAYQKSAVTLADGGSVTVYVSVAVPAHARHTESNTTTVRLSSQGDPLVGEEVILITTVKPSPILLPLLLKEIGP